MLRKGIRFNELCHYQYARDLPCSNFSISQQASDGIWCQRLAYLTATFEEGKNEATSRWNKRSNYEHFKIFAVLRTLPGKDRVILYSTC